jgi:DNA-binding ferritin-like protein
MNEKLKIIMNNTAENYALVDDHINTYRLTPAQIAEKAVAFGFTARDTLAEQIENKLIKISAEYSYAAEVKIADLTASLKSAVDALNVACNLLPVPEHSQDDEWYEHEMGVHKTLIDLKAKHPDMFKEEV